MNLTDLKDRRTALLGKLKERVGLRLGVALLVVVIAGVAAAVYLLDRESGLPDDAAFQVGDHVETVPMLEDRVEVLEAMYGVKPPKGDDQTDEFRREVAKALAVQYLLQDEADAQGIEIADKAAERALRQMIEETLAGDRSQYQEFLASSGISHQQVLDELKAILATNELRASIVADVAPPTKDELLLTYTSRRSEMVSAERRHLANIVTADRGSARAALRELRSGASFVEVTASYSLDAATRPKGGDLGWLLASDLEEPFASVAFDAGQGEVFGPVRTTHGWNVGKVLDIRPGARLSFRDVRRTLWEALFADARNERWQDWLAEAIERADIEYAEDYRPEDPTSVPSEVGLSPSPSAG